jgi:capsular polysaccharide biosynthesis protein
VTNNPAKPPTDPTYLALNQASTGAHQQASDLLQKLSQSQVDVQNANQPGALGFRVIDPPQVPRQSTGHSKNIILGGGIGLGVGLLIALILLLILVLGDDTVRNAKELAALTGLEVVGSAPLDGEFARRPAPPRTVGTATRGG